MERYFASHNERHSATVTLGQTPWHQTVRWDRTAATLESGVFDDETFLHAGEDAKFVHDAVTELRSAIMGHKRRMANVFEGEDGVHEAEKVSSQHDSAARRVAEQSLIDKILSEANESIGGTLQKLELAPGQRAACTRMSAEYSLDQDMNLSADGLLFRIDYTEEMGRPCGGPRATTSA